MRTLNWLPTVGRAGGTPLTAAGLAPPPLPAGGVPGGGPPGGPPVPLFEGPPRVTMPLPRGGGVAGLPRPVGGVAGGGWDGGWAGDAAGDAAGVAGVMSVNSCLT